MARLTILCALTACLSAWGQDLPAFPSAEGFGAQSAGGRGGRVIPVTNLNDRGPGSLRAAVEAEGPRTIVFETAGLITLEAPLDIESPHITIQGQTAPGDGICLKNFGVRIRDTHDVILRHLRIRPGAHPGNKGDALLIYRSQRVLVDHCSLSWSVDETLDISDDWHEPIDGPKTDNVTVQWCIISESLNASTHEKGEHGFAALVSALRDADITLHHNLFAHHKTRVPRPGGRQGTPGLRLEFRNNVLYNWGTNYAGYASESKTAAVVALCYVDNYLKPGPNTPEKGREVAFLGVPTLRLYESGNLVETNNGLKPPRFKGEYTAIPTPNLAPDTPRESATDAYIRVLESAGATLPKRDTVDARIVRDVRSGTGHLIDSPEDVGGWPEYRK